MNEPMPDNFSGSSLHKFECRVRMRDTPSQSNTVTIEARDADDARQQLLDKGYLIISIHDQAPMSFAKKRALAGGGAKKALWSAAILLPTVSTNELIFFAVQLSTLLKAGIPLLRAIEIIRKGTNNVYFQKVLESLAVRVSQGAPLSAGMKEFNRVFPWIWINLVEVGEATGQLPEVLEEISRYQAASERIKGKVISALFYPAILTCAVVGAVIFLLIYIVPKFAEIFKAQHLTLPAITQVVVGLSGIVREQFIPVAIVATALVVGVVVLQQTKKGRLMYDLFRLGFPVFGALLIQVAVVRFSRSMATLLRAGVQILQALDIAGKLVENRFLETKIKQVAKGIKGGHGFGLQLESKKVFPVFMTQLVAVGEESGELERFLDLIANFYEERVDTFLGRLATIIEPLMLIIMGGIIGTVVISMFLPIIELSTKGGGG